MIPSFLSFLSIIGKKKKKKNSLVPFLQIKSNRKSKTRIDERKETRREGERREREERERKKEGNEKENNRIVILSLVLNEHRYFLSLQPT